jgi:hypothetical protein
MMAMEGNSETDIITTVKQVIHNCVLNDDFDIEKAPFFDVDMLFIFLRAKSIGDSIDVNLTCNNTLENGLRCGHTFSTQMDISKNELIKDENITNDIKLDKNSGVMMKYPSYALMKQLDGLSDSERTIKVILNSIEHIYDKKGVYSAKDYSTKELQDFIESLTEEHYNKLERFVQNFPTFIVKLEADCPKCGYHHIVRYADFHDFFF